MMDESELLRLRQDVDAINHILRDGNGQQPFIVRLALVEQSLKVLAEEVKSCTEAIQSQVSENVKGKWGLVGIVIAGLMSLFASVIAFLK